MAFGFSTNDARRIARTVKGYERYTAAESMQRKVIIGEGDGAGYDGMFKVELKTGEENSFLTVTDNGDQSAAAGFGYVNGMLAEWKAVLNLIPEEGWLCLWAKSPSCDTGYEILDKIPDMPNVTDRGNTDAKGYYPVAKIEKQDSESDSWLVRQLSRYEFPQIWIGGPCDEEELPE